MPTTTNPDGGEAVLRGEEYAGGEDRGGGGAGPRGMPEVTAVAEVVLPLTVRVLTAADLPSCAWSGGSAHLAAIAAALDRARRGEVEFLAVCPPSGVPVGLGGIDYVKVPGAGFLWMLSVHGALQSCGIGTILIEAAEQRIRARGRRRAGLAVEETNPRARALYERLGYVEYGRAPESWDEQAEDGSVFRYKTMCTLMRKELG